MDFRPLLSQGTRGMEKAVILCDGYFGQSTGKTANGLVRYSKRYEIAGVIDHTKAGRDAGDVLDGKPNGIPIVANLKEAIERCQPETLIIGVATFGGYMPKEFRPVIREAIEHPLNVVAGLHELLNDDPEFVNLAEAHRPRLVDVRKPPPIRDASARDWRRGPGEHLPSRVRVRHPSDHHGVHAVRDPDDARARPEDAVVPAGHRRVAHADRGRRDRVAPVLHAPHRRREGGRH